MCSHDDFTALLAGGTLCAAQQFTGAASAADFGGILANLVRAFHLTVVEVVDTTASLFGAVTGDDRVCLLLKVRCRW